ncbi:hypothetical protein ACTFIW_003386 [Dictyostelium discoideum]
MSILRSLSLFFIVIVLFSICQSLVIDNISDSTLKVWVSSFSEKGLTNAFTIKPNNQETYARGEDNIKNVLVIQCESPIFKVAFLVSRNDQVLVHENKDRLFVLVENPMDGEQQFIYPNKFGHYNYTKNTFSRYFYK